MKTKLFASVALMFFACQWTFAQENDTTKVANSLEKEKEKGVYNSDFNFYGIELNDRNNEFVIKFKNKDNYNRNYSKHYLITDFDFGFNSIKENMDPKVANVEYPDFNFWKSMYIGFSINGKSRMFGEFSPFFIKYGAGLQWDNYVVKGDYMLEKNNGQPQYDFDPLPNGRDIIHSKLKNLYLNIPLMLQFDFSDRKTEEGFKLGFGAYAGIRMYTWQKIEYRDQDGDYTKMKIRNQYYVNPFNYGLQAEIGYEELSLHLKYELSPFFEVDNPYDYKILRIGLKIAM